MSSVPYRHNYIGGDWQAARRGGRIAVVNPANEAVIGSIPAATEEDVQAAVSAASKAFAAWGKTTGAHRADLLNKIAEQVHVSPFYYHPLAPYHCHEQHEAVPCQPQVNEAITVPTTA